METVVEFVRRLSTSVGCYYHLCDSGYFALKKVNSNIRREMRVFAYVMELKRTGKFRIDTWKDYAERAGVTQLADDERPKLMWGSPGVWFFVRKCSTGEDYQKAVRALKAILALR